MDPSTTSDYLTHIESVAENIKKELNAPDGFSAALVLGSGLNQFVEDLKSRDCSSVPYDKIGMPPTGVEGHIGAVFAATFGQHKIMCFAGRFHAYEGYPGYTTCFLPRVAAMCGCRYYIATNAAGGSAEGMQAGDIMLITDHINATKLSVQSEVQGDSRFGPSIISGSDIYSTELHDIARNIVKEIKRPDSDELVFKDRKLFEGVYMWSGGPSYETFAEVRRGQAHGASAYGMSTVPEAIAARALGMNVFGLSLISNLAAGISPVPLTHGEVVIAAKEASPRVSAFITALLERLPVKSFECPITQDPSVQADIPVRPLRSSYPAVSEIEKAVRSLGCSIDFAVHVSNVYGSEMHSLICPASSLIKKVSVPSLLGSMCKHSFAASNAELAIYGCDSGSICFIQYNLPASECILYGLEPVEISLVTTILRLSGARAFVQLSPSVSIKQTTNSLVVVKDIAHLTNTSPAPLSHPAYLVSQGFSVDFSKLSELIAPEEVVSGVGSAANVAAFPAPVLPSPSEVNIAVQSNCDSIVIDNVGFLDTARALGASASMICSNTGVFSDSDITSRYTVVANTHKQAIGNACNDLLTKRQFSVSPLSAHDSANTGAIPVLYNPHELCYDSGFVTPVDEAIVKIREASGMHEAAVVYGIIGPLNLSQYAEFGITVYLGSSIIANVFKLKDDTFIIHFDGDLNSNNGAPIRRTGLITRILARLKAEKTLVLLPIINTAENKNIATFVNDHVNIWQDSALWGHNDPVWGPRFPDMSNLYTDKLRETLCAKFGDSDVCTGQGTVVFHFGPISNCELSLAQYLKCNGVVTGRGMEIVSLRHCSLPLACVGYTMEALEVSNLDFIKSIVKEFIETA
ncbi:hypothetical protein P9112_004785 [Eukaryota sp. TZLM1-RC]